LKLLVTRPEPDGERTAAALRARGHEVWLAPLSRIEPLSPELGPGPWAAVLITSANAARALEVHQRHQEVIRLPVLAVGRRSRQAARRAGFDHIVSANGTAKDLVHLAAALYAGEGPPLLYLAGADRATDLVAELAEASVPVEMRVIYQSVANADLPGDAADLLRRGGLGGVVHFSRRGAEFFLQAAVRKGLIVAALATMHFCLSARVAEPLAAAGAKTVRVANRPTEESLLQLIDSV